MPHDPLHTAHVTHIATEIPDLQAFRIIGPLTGEDVSALSQHVQGIFEQVERGDMLIAFEPGGDPHIIPAYNGEGAQDDAMALKNLRNLAVVNAPDHVHALLDAIDKVVPVAIRSFHSEAEALAWLQSSHSGRG